MKRREFVNQTIKAGILTTASLTFGKIPDLLAFTPKEYDLIAIKGGEPHLMFDQAIKSLGGMQAFVKKGDSVVVKPNIGWDVIPERAANTNPILVKRIVEHCIEVGAKDVYVFDHTCDDWNRCYSTSGIERAVKDAGGKIVPGNSERYFQEVTVSKGKRLRKTKVHELILESDVFINVPILKSHSSADLTISMKNLMGIVWDRWYWHRNDLHQCIADFASFRKPDLNIVDAYYVMTKNGPRGVSKSDVVTLKSQIVSADIVAADAAAAKLFGSEPNEIDYMKIASDMEIGEIDLSKLNINRIIL
ncbi:MAG: DUF362 domain-containing protein [Ignavibacteria bacterium]|nr:DUF362 domain-containing protein [Ignavibacteria bacterium]MBT8382217.1 DUF362 domain-containing protein [Ignavibacteria bacterium]MBT8390926.1 DUF362 domain-containing protein [Ignavibacteria bacterium]NNJ52373.1 DUF362 domain-containing protein [Ignavibacteriaceae bacterium]NNL20592.1 DUF362 domain-containing protein [Ignavibacteriaceae bacterium]